MPGSAHARLTIEFDLSADPIAGVVHDGSAGTGRAFTGWMALTGLIEDTLDAARRDGPPRPQAAPGRDPR